MNFNNTSKINLVSIAIPVCGFIYYLFLGYDVKFVTGGLWVAIANLFDILILFSQFIFHVVVLLILLGKNKSKQTFTSKQKGLVGVYIIVAVIINIFLINVATNDSKEEVASKQKWDDVEKYDWEPAISCPEGCPVRVLEGGFANTYLSSLKHFDAKLYDIRWGVGLATFTEGLDAMPDSLQLVWYSVIENKFYKLNVRLDNEKIISLFRTFVSKHPDGIDEIVAGLAPSGNVAVWVGGNWGNIVEVGFYKATEIDSAQACRDIPTEWKDEIEKAEINPENKWIENLNSKNIPYDKWSEKYRQKYNFRIQFKTDLALDKTKIEVNLYNGEQFSMIDSALSEKQTSLKALPSYFVVKYLSQQRHTEQVSADFDEEDIFSAFKKLSKNNLQIPITLECRINKAGIVESATAKTDIEKLNLKVKTDD